MFIPVLSSLLELLLLLDVPLWLGVDLAFNWRRIGLGTRLVIYMIKL